MPVSRTTAGAPPAEGDLLCCQREPATESEAARRGVHSEQPQLDLFTDGQPGLPGSRTQKGHGAEDGAARSAQRRARRRTRPAPRHRGPKCVARRRRADARTARRRRHVSVTRPTSSYSSGCAGRISIRSCWDPAVLLTRCLPFLSPSILPELSRPHPSPSCCASDRSASRWWVAPNTTLTTSACARAVASNPESRSSLGGYTGMAPSAGREADVTRGVEALRPDRTVIVEARTARLASHDAGATGAEGVLRHGRPGAHRHRGSGPACGHAARAHLGEPRGG